MGFIENAMRAREARGRSPAFRAEMARENAEFMDILMVKRKCILREC